MRVVLRVNEFSFNDILRRVRDAGQGDRLVDGRINLFDVALEVDPATRDNRTEEEKDLDMERYA